MPHPYDASTKYLLESRLADWLPLSGRTSTAELKIINADLSTVTAAADRVLQVCEDPPWLLHVELQSTRDQDLLPNLPAYNILLARRHGTLVRTLVVLLRKSADWPEMTGLMESGFRDEPPYLVFRYQVVRIWQIAAETILKGGLGILPLAPLSAVSESELPGVIRRMDERIRAEATPADAGILWTATDVLMGLRYSSELVSRLLEGIRGMRESVTYQAIVEEGEMKGMLRALRRFGTDKFGPPNEECERALGSIADPDRLDRMVSALRRASNWEELLEMA